MRRAFGYPTSEDTPTQSFDEWAADGKQIEYDTRTDPALEPDPFSPREWNQQVKYIEEGGPAEAWAVELYNLEGSSHYDLFESALASASADQYRRDRNSMGRQTALLNQIELVQRLAVRERAANRWDVVFYEGGGNSGDGPPTIERGADPLGSDKRWGEFKVYASFNPKTSGGLRALETRARAADSAIEEASILAELQRGTRDSSAVETANYVTDILALAMGEEPIPDAQKTGDAEVDLQKQISQFEEEQGSKLRDLGIFRGWQAHLNFYGVKWYWWLGGAVVLTGGLTYWIKNR